MHGDTCMVMLEMALWGGLGGLVRSMVGVSKAVQNKRKFVWPYFLITVALAAGIGFLLGGAIGTNPAVALLIGYAGTDFLENVGKAFRIVPIKIG